MDVACVGGSFGESHFGSCSLGDARRTRRLVKTADLIMRHPGGTLPDKLRGNWADLIGLYRLAAAERVTHQAVIAGHCRRTLELAAARAGVVLLLHDSTELDYTQLLALDEQEALIGDFLRDSMFEKIRDFLAYPLDLFNVGVRLKPVQVR